MQLALGGIDALRVLRALRHRGVNVSTLPRTDLVVPDPSPFQRFRANHLDLGSLLLGTPPTSERPLHVCVPSRSAKPRAGFFQCAIVAPENVPAGSFLDLGDGLQIPCPELVFLQATSFMLPVIQLALGMELCGRFGRSPYNPVQENSRLGIEPVTTANRIVTYLDTCRNLPGLAEARYLAGFLCDEAWSPMEAAAAALFALPFDELGYGLAPLTLNRRFGAANNMPGHKTSRVPDILFTGTHVGLNYDGSEHLDLDGIVAAAQDAVRDGGERNPSHGSSSGHTLGCGSGRNPTPGSGVGSGRVLGYGSDQGSARDLGCGSGHVSDQAVKSAIQQVRDKYVDDHRRDRELLSQGLAVLPITIEDFHEPGGLDAIAAWVIEQIESEGARDLSLQKATLKAPTLARARQQVVWSLLPGKRGRAARKLLVEPPFIKTNPRTVFEGELEW